MHSLITPVPYIGKAGWYETFRNQTYLAINSQKCRALLIGDPIFANSRKFPYTIFLFTVVQRTLVIIIQRLFQMA